MVIEKIILDVLDYIMNELDTPIVLKFSIEMDDDVYFLDFYLNEEINYLLPLDITNFIYKYKDDFFNDIEDEISNITSIVVDPDFIGLSSTLTSIPIHFEITPDNNRFLLTSLYI